MHEHCSTLDRRKVKGCWKWMHIKCFTWLVCSQGQCLCNPTFPVCGVCTTHNMRESSLLSLPYLCKASCEALWCHSGSRFPLISKKKILLLRRSSKIVKIHFKQHDLPFPRSELSEYLINKVSCCLLYLLYFLIISNIHTEVLKTCKYWWTYFNLSWFLVWAEQHRISLFFLIPFTDNHKRLKFGSARGTATILTHPNTTYITSYLDPKYALVWMKLWINC